METFTTTHWGSYRVEVEQGRLVGVHPVAWDRHPSPIGQSLPDTVHGPSRVRRPAVREGFLEKGAALARAPRRRALRRGELGRGDLARRRRARARAPRARQRGDLRRLVRLVERGPLPPRAEPGAPLPERDRRLRPHVGHLQPRRRAAAAAARIAWAWTSCGRRSTRWVAAGRALRALRRLRRACRRKNSQVNAGGATTTHESVTGSASCARPASSSSTSRRCGTTSPRCPTPSGSRSGRTPTPRSCSRSPHADRRRACTTARSSTRYTSGFDRFRRVRAAATRDGQPKSREWAAPHLPACSAETIRGLARRMAGKRTMINVAWSLQRADSRRAAVLARRHARRACSARSARRAAASASATPA